MILRLRAALLCVALCGSSACEAAFVSVYPLVNGLGDPPERAVVDSAGAPLAFGYAGTGIFSASDAQVDVWVNSGNLQALIAAFSPVIGSDNFQNGLPLYLSIQAIPGLFATANILDPEAQGLVGASLYTFIGNGASLGESTEIGLFLHDVTLAADPPFGQTDYHLNLGEGSVKVGLLTTVEISMDPIGTGTPTLSALQLIPEPSSVFMACLGAGLLFRRRR